MDSYKAHATVIAGNIVYAIEKQTTLTSTSISTKLTTVAILSASFTGTTKQELQ